MNGYYLSDKKRKEKVLYDERKRGRLGRDVIGENVSRSEFLNRNLVSHHSGPWAKEDVTRG